ncbi:ras GTPase-activating protein-binding protein 2 isoform X2 [Copidosoma floridanum]|uniref:ras GTPase-activating protein-binding protein 2 isoform X2 n=1 Tax=Copidosoma floridanum TaxID=29053 RepID=UPI0006C9E227|nr:ras GTPase-activating protein-binding protein 2 isoform X2 [Copidosoma floridanum]
MVMEASPSPQSVGREFVRQYYTLLHSAPAHLHRFYNNYSSFIHGGLDSNRESSPAIGQKQIHQKIQALNFHDCHTKITQVDSQLTLGSGVVVQVSGELSNNGNPMRRFTQTFVLAPQAPKKYYVHNDIFRYQDFGYSDEDEEGESERINEVVDREGESEKVRAETEEESQQGQIPQLTSKIGSIEQHSQIQQQPVPLSQQQPMYFAMPSQQPLHPVPQQMTINGSVHEDTPIIPQQPVQQQQALLQQQQQQQQPPQVSQQQYMSEPVAQEQFQQESEPESQPQQQQLPPIIKSEVPTDENERIEVESSYVSSVQKTEPEHQVSSPPISSGPKTYANLVKSSIGTVNPQVLKQTMSPPPIQNVRIDDRVPTHHQQSAGTSLPTSSVMQMGPHIHRMSGPQQQQQQQQQPQQTQQQQYPQRLPRTSLPVQPRDGERRRPGYTDAHQLFLGNLPHNASENDLRQVFERYGRVADLRVHSKQNDRTKGPPGQGQNNTRVPNYGFITFEDSSVVSKVLDDLPIYFPDENGQKLNVEEKKFRPRENQGGRPSLGGDVNMRSLGGQQQQQQQQQRGPGGPGGMMRGGQHGTRGRGAYNRGGGEGGRGGLRQPSGNPNNQNFQNRR